MRLHCTVLSRAHPHRHAFRYPSPRSWPNLGIQKRSCFLTPLSSAASSPTNLPAPCSWFPFRNLQTFFPRSISVLIIHCERVVCLWWSSLQRVAAKGCCRGRKITEGERDSALAVVCGCHISERKKRRTAPGWKDGEGWKRKREQPQERMVWELDIWS